MDTCQSYCVFFLGSLYCWAVSPSTKGTHNCSCHNISSLCQKFLLKNICFGEYRWEFLQGTYVITKRAVITICFDYDFVEHITLKVSERSLVCYTPWATLVTCSLKICIIVGKEEEEKQVWETAVSLPLLYPKHATLLDMATWALRVSILTWAPSMVTVSSPSPMSLSQLSTIVSKGNDAEERPQWGFTHWPRSLAPHSLGLFPGYQRSLAQALRKFDSKHLETPDALQCLGKPGRRFPVSGSSPSKNPLQTLPSRAVLPLVVFPQSCHCLQMGNKRVLCVLCQALPCAPLILCQALCLSEWSLYIL